MIVAGICLQATKAEHEAELAEEREEDRPVLEAVQKAQARAKLFKESTTWFKMPLVLQALLVLGSFSACAMFHITLEYFCKPFLDYEVTDTIAQKLQGNIFNVVLPPGWVANAYIGLSL